MRTCGFIVALVVLTLALLACGPVSEPPISQAEPANPTATSEPESTSTPFPTKVLPPQPTHIPTKTPLPYTSAPAIVTDLPHPDGLDGCKSITLYGDEIEGIALYQAWCLAQLTREVADTCGQETDTAAQLRCGESIVAEYSTTFLHDSSAKCVGITEGAPRVECFRHSSEAVIKALDSIWDAVEKVRIAGNRYPDVVKAMDDVITCLEGKGFDRVNHDLLFGWQKTLRPSEQQARNEKLSPADKELRDRMVQPTMDCSKQEGLYDAQKVAWATELRRLDEEEPELVEVLIREGLLEALEKPGITIVLTGEVSPHLREHFGK